mgnify:CR=1 FL=1
MRKITIIFCVLCFLHFSAKAQIPSDPYEEGKPKREIDGHIPGSGFKLFDGERGAMTFSFFASSRYLNQMGLDTSYTDHLGREKFIDRRNDLQFQKVMLYFKGWFTNPRFRYLLYVWTSNVSQGLGAQVVVAGNIQYEISKFLDVGIGIGGLPTTRALLGQFPGWLRQDARPMAEEYFRGSFTTGVWAQGEITKNLYYKTMLGNNMSQLGIDAGQLDPGLDTWSTSIWWTSENYGRVAPFGDFFKTEKPGGMIGMNFTRSNETDQSQPGQNAPENSQIRISDGTPIFSRMAFGEDIQITDAKYEMLAVNGGIKYKGFSLDAEYYTRWVSKIEGTGAIPVDELFDTGFTIRSSMMLVKNTLQGYFIASRIMGEYGNPTEYVAGTNIFPFGNKVFRINPELVFSNFSAVGYQSYPVPVGANGTTFMLNFEILY